MSVFPKTPILDSGAGANEDPIAVNWSGPIFSGIAQLRRVSNQIAPNASAFGGSYIDLSQYGPDCEAYATIAALQAIDTIDGYLYVRAQNVGTTSLDGYIVMLFRSSGVNDDGLQLAVETDGADTALGFSGGFDWAVGDKYGIRANKNRIEAWRCPSGGSWTRLISAVDSTYASAGYIGLAAEASSLRLTDIGGGTAQLYPFVSDQDSASAITATA